MAESDDNLSPAKAIELLFGDASKTISDLKSREWTATTLAVAALVGLDSITHGSDAGKQRGLHVLFMVAILIGHHLVYWRCTTNLNRFRERLRVLIRDRFPEKMHDLFEDKKEFKDAIVDEGTISLVAFFAVWLAFLFATRDIWSGCFGT